MTKAHPTMPSSGFQRLGLSYEIPSPHKNPYAFQLMAFQDDPPDRINTSFSFIWNLRQTLSALQSYTTITSLTSSVATFSLPDFGRL